MQPRCEKLRSDRIDYLSFDGMADLYDETRLVDAAALDSALDWLAETFPPQRFPRVLDCGAGTGRIAVPLGRRGYRVVAGDVSAPMLALLCERLGSGSPLPVAPLLADAVRLPFTGAAFDLGLVVHLFYFLRQWRQAVDELLRVVSEQGWLLLMHTGTGAEIPLVNERYRALCAEAGAAPRPLGVVSTGEVVAYLRDKGAQPEERSSTSWQWTATIPLAQALRYVDQRAYSFTALIPEPVHRQVCGRLRLELAERFGGLDVGIDVPNAIRIVIVHR